MNWNSPQDRARLIHEVGPAEYQRQQAEHWKATTVATVNGYAIRPISTRFGRLFSVMGAARAFRTQAEAEGFARTLAVQS